MASAAKLKNGGGDALDDLMEHAAEVTVRGTTIVLRIPEFSEIKEIREHVSSAKDDIEGQEEDWYLKWCAMCLRATVTGMRDREVHEWMRVMMLAADQDTETGVLVAKAMQLCGFKAAAQLSEGLSDKIGEVDETVGDLPTTSQAQPAEASEAS